MSAVTTTEGTDTTVAFTKTAPTAKVLEVVNAVAENLWSEETDKEGVVTNPFADATNTEKLAVADKHVWSVLLSMANTFLSRKAQDEARATAEESKLVI